MFAKLGTDFTELLMVTTKKILIMLQALRFGWLDFSQFDVEEYEHYEVLSKY